ncbi:MAG TPA: Spy/CpxP family protein refolding chaperone [Stellaceae bacterium]|jgi:uncharacterized membrane protein YfbV (UPF0208 family)|nr:Spy/CpxP family protein refolding chaperone [Stellaceae bacterium]
MKMILSSRFAPVAVAALLSLPAAAWAQSSQSPKTQGATPPPPAAAASPMANHPVPGKNAEERVENRIKELHAQLRITSAEEPQWNQFAEVMRANARSMDQTFSERAQNFESMNAVQNMQSYEKLAQTHAQDLEKLVPAFQKLYDAMPDQQKQLADQVFRANAEQHAQRPAAHHGRSG